MPEGGLPAFLIQDVFPAITKHLTLKPARP
jgi:hypothetical protein